MKNLEHEFWNMVRNGRGLFQSTGPEFIWGRLGKKAKICHDSGLKCGVSRCEGRESEMKQHGENDEKYSKEQEETSLRFDAKYRYEKWNGRRNLKAWKEESGSDWKISRGSAADKQAPCLHPLSSRDTELWR